MLRANWTTHISSERRSAMGDRLTAAPATYTATFGIFRGLLGSSLGAPLNMSEAILLLAG